MMPGSLNAGGALQPMLPRVHARGVFRRIGHQLSSAAKHVARSMHAAATDRTLAQLDEHLLRDIGLWDRVILGMALHSGGDIRMYGVYGLTELNAPPGRPTCAARMDVEREIMKPFWRA